MPRIGKFLVILLSIVLLAINFYLGTSKKLWLDEIYTVYYSSAQSPFDIIVDLFKGTDVNPPFYYILINFLLDILSDEILVLKIFNAFITFLSIPVIIKLVKENFDSDKSYILITILAVTGFFSQYLIIELRSYGLFFVLFVLFLFLLLELIKEDEKLKLSNFALLTLTATLLLYTHYFAIPYVLTLLSLLALRKRKFIFFIPIIITLIFYLPWLFAIRNQLASFNYTMWQPDPSIIQLFKLPFFYFGNGIILLIIISILIIVKEGRIKKLIKRIKYNKDMFIIFSIVLIIPIILFFLAKIQLLPFVERYYVPSFVVSVIFLGMLIDEAVTSLKYEIILILVLLFIGILKTQNFSESISIENQKLDNYLNQTYNNSFIVCESPHLFFPLSYYSTDNTFFWVVDSTSAKVKGNISNSLFDYYLAKLMRSKYNLEKIKEWSEFIAVYKSFIIIDEPGRMLFEYYIEGNSSYMIKKINKNVYFVVKK